MASDAEWHSINEEVAEHRRKLFDALSPEQQAEMRRRFEAFIAEARRKSPTAE